MADIHNDHNVYVIGAGFSRARGLPLISDFMFALRDAHEWLQNEERINEASAVQKVLEFRQKSTASSYRVQIDLENIEELFSLASAAEKALTDQIRVAIAATLEYRLAQRQSPKTKLQVENGAPSLPACLTRNVLHPGASANGVLYEASTYDVIVAGLLGLLDQRRSRAANTFVTFNYDTLIEEALTSLQHPFSYGFPARTTDQDPSVSELALAAEARTSVLKLHGSTNWAYPRQRGNRLTAFGSYDHIRMEQYIPELIPPTWHKSVDGPLSHVWERALGEISRATRLVVIGFSMPATDLHFKYLIAAGLRDNISLREILFVNPDKDTVEQRAATMFGDLVRRPTVRFVGAEIARFVTQGELAGAVASIGRSIHRSIQHIDPSY
jgi:hypothetical protein